MSFYKRGRDSFDSKKRDTVNIGTHFSFTVFESTIHVGGVGRPPRWLGAREEKKCVVACPSNSEEFVA